MLAFLFHHIVLFLAHCTAHQVSLAIGEAGQLPADLHDLLLIHDAAVGHVQNVRQFRRFIADLVRLAAVAQVGGNGIHGAGAVQADQSDDVLKALRVQPGQNLPHACGFQLEHTLGFALGQHFVGGLVLIGDGIQRKIRLHPANHLLGVVQHRQGTQAQKVHLQQAQLLNGGHVELGHRHAVVGGKGHILIGRLPGDHHACRVGRGMAGHSLDLDGGVDQLLHLGIGVVAGFQLRRNLHGPVQGHFQLHRHQFGDSIHLLIGDVQHTAHVPNGRTGRHGSEGNDLGHMVMAVLPVHIVNDLLPPFVAEVHVKVGHTHALRIQKAFEQQVVPNGVDVGNAYAVGAQAARATAAAGAYRNSLAFCVIDKVEHNEVIVGVPHALDDPNFIFQALGQLRVGMFAVAAHQTFPAELLKVLLIFHSVRRFKVRQLGHAKLKIEVTLLGNFVGVLTRFRADGEQIVHLIGAFEVELVRLKFHPILVVHGFARLNADQDALHLAVFLAQVVGIVGGHQRNARLFGKAEQLGQHRLLLLNAVVLNLQVVISLSKQVVVPQRNFLGAVVITGQQRLRHLARQAG